MKIICLILSLAVSAIAADRVKVNQINIGLKTNYETILTSKSLQQTSPSFAAQSPQEIALNYVQGNLGVKKGEYVVKDAYRTTSTGITHVYLKQLVGGMEVSNGDVAVHVNAKGQVIAQSNEFSHGNQASFASKAQLWSAQPSSRASRPRDAFKVFADYIKKPIDTSKLTETSVASISGTAPRYSIRGVPFAVKDVTAQQSYLQLKDGSLVPAWEYTVKMPSNYFHVHISSDGQKILSLVDWTSEASYNVIKFGGNNPVKQPRVKLTDPADATASPNGWHTVANKTSNDTTGNNVNALVDSNSVRGGNNLTFDFPLDLTKEPSGYKQASATNLFYVNNMLHDLFYHYGFDEVSGNFQKTNNNKGGKENDQVIAYAQDPSGSDNAYFETPPDGENGEMHMFTWDITTPGRDGDLENDIISHEFGHGVSTRLTGGPSNSDCLNSGESGGMGEGWSDFFALWIEQTANNTDNDTFALGEYVYTQSIRTYRYSTSNTTNPTNYGYLNDGEWQEVHSIGEIWANILYQYYWNFVDKLGFTDNKFKPDITKGNTLALKLVVDGLKLQPCRPTFVDARNAILLAEKQATNGTYACLIWKAFAKRGVGVKAASDGETVTANFDLPSECATS